MKWKEIAGLVWETMAAYIKRITFLCTNGGTVQLHTLMPYSLPLFEIRTPFYIPDSKLLKLLQETLWWQWHMLRILFLVHLIFNSFTLSICLCISILHKGWVAVLNFLCCYINYCTLQVLQFCVLSCKFIYNLWIRF